MVCVLPGCIIPLITRPAKSQQKEDMLVATVHGSAYLHHYMDGKPMEYLDLGKLGLTVLNLKQQKWSLSCMVTLLGWF